MNAQPPDTVDMRKAPKWGKKWRTSSHHLALEATLAVALALSEETKP